MIRVVVAIVLAFAVPAASAANVELNPVVLGGNADPTLLARVEGQWQVRGGGREAYMGRDEGTFAGMRTSATDFDFTARLVRFESNSANPKIGISLRTATSGVDRSISLRFDGHAANRCLQWFYRHRVASTAHEGSRACFLDGLAREFDLERGLWLRIERRYPRVRLLASRDGQQWTDVAPDHHLAMVDQDVLVGLQVTAGGDGGMPATATFDHVRLDVVGGEPARSEQRLFPEPPPKPQPVADAPHPGAGCAGKGRGSGGVPAHAARLGPATHPRRPAVGRLEGTVP